MSLIKKFNVVFHLVKRFFGEFSAQSLTDNETSWVMNYLSDAEAELWNSMNKQDQRHGYMVSQITIKLITDTKEINSEKKIINEEELKDIVAAALLHDIGKVPAQLNTLGRTFATVVGKIYPNIKYKPFRIYLDHHVIGCQMLKESGSSALVYTWAKEHELDPTFWTIDKNIANILIKADNLKDA